jgi:ABC-type enterobactin transport system permease subunit
MEITTVGLPSIASPILALLATENPQVMIAIGGVLCAIFGGVTAAFVAWKNNTTLFKITKFNICIIGILVGIVLLSLLPFMGLTCRWCTSVGS